MKQFKVMKIKSLKIVLHFMSNVVDSKQQSSIMIICVFDLK